MFSKIKEARNNFFSWILFLASRTEVNQINAPFANHEGDVKYRNFRNLHRPLNSDSSGYSNSQITSQTRNIYEGDHPDAAIYAPALGVNYRRRPPRKESFGSGRSSPSSSLESTRSNSSSSLASSMMTLTSVDSR